MFKLKNEKPRITAAIFFEIIVLPIVKLYQNIIRIKSFNYIIVEVSWPYFWKRESGSSLKSSRLMLKMLNSARK